RAPLVYPPDGPAPPPPVPRVLSRTGDHRTIPPRARALHEMDPGGALAPDRALRGHRCLRPLAGVPAVASLLGHLVRLARPGLSQGPVVLRVQAAVPAAPAGMALLHAG